jgi:hypothetical protein
MVRNPAVGNIKFSKEYNILLITAYIITGLKKLDANFIYNTSTEAA